MTALFKNFLLVIRLDMVYPSFLVYPHLVRKKALKELRSQKEIKSIILDLRGNPGGLLDVAVDICDKFLNKELLIVTTRGRDDAKF